jgi:hypothetical protein
VCFSVITRAGFKWATVADAPGPPENRGLHKIQVLFTAKIAQVIIAGNRSRDRELAQSGRVGVSSSAGRRAAGCVCIYVFLLIIGNKNIN